MSRHIIHKQKVTVHLTKREDAHFFQNRISDLLQNELMNRVETMFDDLFPPDRIIRIDSLQIDIGNINLQNFEQEFKEGFVKALTKSLTSKKHDLNASNNNEVLSTKRSLVNAFIYFLKKGYLPWYCTATNTKDWETELLSDLSENEYSYFLDWLKDNYRQKPAIMRRLILQFSDSLLMGLLSTEVTSVDKSRQLAFKDYAHLLAKNDKQEDRYEIWEYLFDALLNNKTAVIIDAANGFLDFKDRPRGENETIKQDNGKELSEGWSKGKKQKWEAEEETLYVNNCGVVLLHSFLRPFFEDLGLVLKGKFINEAKWQRAVLLLHYLATGETEVAEFDLTLQKILCGYPTEDTLPAHIVLTRKEKAEVEKLLNTVLSYWEPLKNTSLEGFRNSFLQRSGKLVKKDNGWQITVEQKTIDILLGKLPWGFSTIRLPWMEEILSVDWY